MMPDIFSTFDPASANFFMRWTTMFLITNVILFTVLMNKTYATLGRWSMLITQPLEVMYSQLMRTGAKSLKGLSSIIAPLFLTLTAINLMGMFPYTFSLSSHLIMTLTIGLPLWMSMIISSFMYAPKHSTAHFLPDGAPDWLNPFLVLIETTSVLVRPLTLSFRLAANMTAGHIVLSLVGTYGSAAMMSSLISSSFLVLTSSGYILFEFAICLIQAYIFCLLLSLYSDDHAH